MTLWSTKSRWTATEGKIVSTRPFNFENRNARVWKVSTRGKIGMQFTSRDTRSVGSKSATLYTGWREVSWSGAANSAVVGIAAIGAGLALM